MEVLYFPDYSCESLQDWYETNSKIAFQLWSYIKNIDLSRISLNCEFKIVTLKSEQKYVHGICLWVHSTDPFSKTPISVQSIVGFWEYVPDENIVYQKMRAALHEMMTHEIDECLFVKGEQMFNPHPKV